MKRESRAADPAANERIPSLTDLEGILVGHYTSGRRPTGCTVITSIEPFVAGVDVRGGAPGSYDTELLRAEKTVEKIHAVFLSGGSAFGLAVGAGVAGRLRERGSGLQVEGTHVPVVCGAILFDLGLGDPAICPGYEAGYEACKTASSDAVHEGSVGAGAGATVGKYLGMRRAMKGGLGSWSLRTPRGLQVGALVAVNAVGNVVDPESGKIVAGARNDDGTGFADLTVQARRGKPPGTPPPQGTVIGVVATNARLGKAQCNIVACMAQDAPWPGRTRCLHLSGASAVGWRHRVRPGHGDIPEQAAAGCRPHRDAGRRCPGHGNPARGPAGRKLGTLPRLQGLPGSPAERSTYRLRARISAPVLRVPLASMCNSSVNRQP